MSDSCAKMSLFYRANGHIVVCFHTHSGFERQKKNSFFSVSSLRLVSISFRCQCQSVPAHRFQRVRRTEDELPVWKRACAVAPTRPGGALNRAVIRRRYSGESHPPRMWFSRDQALPRAVRGPVDFFALRRLEAIQSDISVCACGCSGGLRPPSSIGDRRYNLCRSV